MKYKNITAAEAQQWINDKQAIVIDVREPAEFANKHIAGATLLPVGKISANDLPQTDKKVIIYCQKGARGNNACVKLKNEDDTVVVYNLVGGIESWIKEGFDVIQGESKVLPLDRQVQLTIGLLALSGSAAGYFVNPLFMLLPAFLGAGLTFAGLSGTCGLALLMAKMPWNQQLSTQ